MPSRGEMAGQDFNQVSFGSKSGPGAKPNAAPGSRPASAAQRAGGGGSSVTPSGMSAAKLDAETDELKRAACSPSALWRYMLCLTRQPAVADLTVSKDLKLAIIKGRGSKGLTQVQLPPPLPHTVPTAHLPCASCVCGHAAT